MCEWIGELGYVDVVVYDCIFEVVYGVGDVVGEVYDFGFDVV